MVKYLTNKEKAKITALYKDNNDNLEILERFNINNLRLFRVIRRYIKIVILMKKVFLEEIDY
ncbi:hypothetical protein A0H76_1276 [Hepatospora eriocheir]|uniref:HTH psq-type domain-containing protein n=1 Tax=Hepatospora eriocheir TaxID=1081669 RepID=A0A1X0QHE0_9MICR|nr:hypothetical protein A0H76_1276 [Hepatospora eriocheir]